MNKSTTYQQLNKERKSLIELIKQSSINNEKHRERLKEINAQMLEIEKAVTWG